MKASWQQKLCFSSFLTYLSLQKWPKWRPVKCSHELDELLGLSHLKKWGCHLRINESCPMGGFCVTGKGVSSRKMEPREPKCLLPRKRTKEERKVSLCILYSLILKKKEIRLFENSLSSLKYSKRDRRRKNFTFYCLQEKINWTNLQYQV